MTGLEKIISQIEQDSASACEEIMNEAKANAREIITAAKEKAEAESQRIIEDAEAEAEKIAASTKTSADAYSRTKYLEVRNAIVNDVIAAAYEEIEKYPDDKYFDFLYKLCMKYIEDGECTMYLSQRDLDRLPDDFEMRLNSEVFETSAIAISKTPGKLSAGFILVYPEFEINCSIKSLFEENMDGLKDQLCDILFND